MYQNTEKWVVIFALQNSTVIIMACTVATGAWQTQIG